MRITSNAEVKKFREVINNCSNTVFLVNNRGEQYDLKTTDGWFMGMSELMHEKDDYSEPEIFTTSYEDEARVVRFILSAGRNGHAA